MTAGRPVGMSDRIELSDMRPLQQALLFDFLNYASGARYPGSPHDLFKIVR
jgi:hypothetical protein